MNILLTRLISDWFAGKELSTAMGVMLTSWPVGLGLATATLGGLAAGSGWRWPITMTAIAAAVGLLLMLVVFREAPRSAGVTAAPARASLAGRDLRLSTRASRGAASTRAWWRSSSSVPALLIARGILGDAGFT
jgi:sugar phosphate permease